MWNNAEKVKLQKTLKQKRDMLAVPRSFNDNERVDYLSRGPNISDGVGVGGDGGSPTDVSFRTADGVPQPAPALPADATWLDKSRLFRIVLHLGDHPLPWLHVGRYLDGCRDWGWQQGQGSSYGRQKRREGSAPPCCFFFFFLLLRVVSKPFVAPPVVR